MTSTLDRIRTYHDELTALRRDLHANPELGLETHRTADIVARLLESWGIEVHRGVGGTGVVGVLRSGNEPQSIGLRADMDALPIEERTGAEHRSRTPGRMHACGHDGHTTMLLGAARHLAETRNFRGTVNFIFQPGEEGAGGALAMIEDGLFERFPCDTIYGLHNRPGMAVGRYGLTPGAMMAGGAFFDIEVTGKGSHGARPNEGIDPVPAACQIVSALQTIVARNISPFETAVVSVTKLHAGDAYNVIPERVRLGGTVRAMKPEVLSVAEAALRRIATSTAEAFGAKCAIDYRVIFAPLVNPPEHAKAICDAAADLVGEERIERNRVPQSGSEDFSFMLERVPGAFLNIGNGERSAALHNDRYDFNDEAIPYGAAVLARIVERQLAPQL